MESKAWAPSRSKRSTTNLANLRLAPLSTRFETSSDESKPDERSPLPETREFTRYHPSYLQGRSAPTTPGILSRSSSRKHLAAGRSRKGSFYDNDGVTYEYAVAMQRERPEVGSGQISKAKSEAALHMPPRLDTTVQASSTKRHHRRTGTGGTATPRVKSRTKLHEVDWLTRTGAATNAVVQESKGQSWLASRDSTASAAREIDTTDDDEDDGYEEMAALSAMSMRLNTGSGQRSPISTRVSRWGSRYGSRTTSRRTSRRGSMTGSRTPLAFNNASEALTSYFDATSVLAEQNSVLGEESDVESADEQELARLATDHTTYSLGSFVDRIMNFSLFNVTEERDDSAAEEDPLPLNETSDEGPARKAAEVKRKREEKQRLVSLPAPVDEIDGEEQEDVGWRDAAWLLSVATRALFMDTGR